MQKLHAIHSCFVVDFRNALSIKTLLLISSQLQILANRTYFIAPMPWLIVIGRIVTGMGMSSEACLNGDIVCVTTIEKRTPFIVSLLAVSQFGHIAGPALTITMHPLKLQITNNFQVCSVSVIVKFGYKCFHHGTVRL